MENLGDKLLLCAGIRKLNEENYTDCMLVLIA